LGVLRLREEINVLSSVTGALEDHCSGKVYPWKG
jgi:anhydro-N-acetylmuramic acid kinase